LDFQFLLTEIFQLLVTGGVGGALIVGLATKDILVKEETTIPDKQQFTSEYEELMWLADRQRHRLTSEEMRRFYQLRREWTLMHSLPTSSLR